MADSPLATRTEHDGAVERFVLNRPKANVLDAAMIGAIREHIAALADRPALRLIVFEGEGPHFCFGASVEEHTREQAPAMLEAFHAMFREIEALSVPTAALIRGQCLGGGLELAAFCSYLIAEDGAQLGQPEIKLAVIAPMASVLLPCRVGEGPAQDLLITGRSVDAEEAFGMGLLNVVAEAETGEETLQAWIGREILPKSPSSLRFAYRTARLALQRRLEQDLPLIERIYLDELMASHDANEGIAAFLERRKPSWGG
jgi:cyclohexa-1,5-dienecarbonyl-CoA hydratase